MVDVEELEVSSTDLATDVEASLIVVVGDDILSLDVVVTWEIRVFVLSGGRIQSFYSVYKT